MIQVRGDVPGVVRTLIKGTSHIRNTLPIWIEKEPKSRDSCKAVAQRVISRISDELDFWFRRFIRVFPKRWEVAEAWNQVIETR
jgi:hypothetical protein